MTTEQFNLGITFSYLGAKAEIEGFLGTKDFEVEVHEFENTPEEHCSGIVNYVLTVNADENVLYALHNFIKQKGLTCECFNLKTLTGITILTEEEYNEITFY